MQHLRNIIQKLSQKYPNPQTPLIHKNLYELMIAVILSAQMTDKRLNTITPNLFRKYPDLKSLSKAKLSDVEQLLSGVNYYKTKTRHIIEVARIISIDYKGKIPNTMKALVELPGIGRKTANVILNEGMNISEGIVVDTHVIRVSNRLGFTKEKNPLKIEQNLMKIIPKEYWKEISLWLIFHGRKLVQRETQM